MVARLPMLLLLVCCAPASLCRAQSDPAPSAATRRIALDSVAHNPRAMFQTVAARLATGVDTGLAWRQLDTLLNAPTGDMFWTYPATCFWVFCRDHLDSAYRRRFRQILRLYTPYRGDTENHFLMHYTYLLIFSEEWPELREDEWFNGRSSAENHAEAREYLLHWIDETARYGLTEWDSPRYLYFYVGPLLALADGSRDTAVSRRAAMLLELLLAEYAVEYLNGAYCGAHSRDGDGSVIDPRRAEATAMGRFYFEDRVDPPLPDLAFCSLSRFACPGIVRRIAGDRWKHWNLFKIRRTRARMRGHTERYGTVMKQTWMARDIALGSVEADGIAQPIQQHTWGITFGVDRPNATIFSVHPDASEQELATYFPEEPELMESGILGSKASYGNENRWIGGSRYEWVRQDENRLVATYSIPATARWHHVDLFIPRSLDTLVRDASGWIFCRMGEGMVAIYPFDTSVVWMEEVRNWRVRLGSAETGLLVLCENEDGRHPFAEFCRRVRQRYRSSKSPLRPDRSARDSQRATFPPSYRRHLGYTTYCRWGDYSQLPLFVDAEHGTARIFFDERVRTLDFVRGTVEENIDDQPLPR